MSLIHKHRMNDTGKDKSEERGRGVRWDFPGSESSGKVEKGVRHKFLLSHLISLGDGELALDWTDKVEENPATWNNNKPCKHGRKKELG